MGRTASGAISGSCTVVQDVPATGNLGLGEVRNRIATVRRARMPDEGTPSCRLVRVRRAQAVITLKINRLAVLPP